MSTALYPHEQVVELSQDEATKLFEDASHRWFKISARAFVRAYDGNFPCLDHDTAKAQFVDSLRRLARK